MIQAQKYLEQKPVPKGGENPLIDVDLSGFEVPVPVLELVPESVARELIVLPLGLRNKTLVMAMLDPTSKDAVAMVQFILNRDVEPVRAPKEALAKAINFYYGQTELQSVTTIHGLARDFDFEMDVAKNTCPLARLVDLIIEEAIEKYATEVYIQPDRDCLRVLYLVRGQLFDRDTPPRRLLELIAARTELLAGMSPTLHGEKQTGRIRGHVRGMAFELGIILDRTKGEPHITLSFPPT